MNKIIILIALLVSVTFAGTKITTKYRTDLNMNTGKSLTQEYISTFEIQEGRFIHSAPNITSVYIAISTAKIFNIGSTQLIGIPCKSEVGNEYLYIFDLPNQRVYCMTSSGEYLVQFDISDISDN